MFFIRSFFFLLLSLYTVHSHAAEQAAPFGFEIGSDTVSSIRTRAIEANNSIKNVGINKYSNGPMFEVDVTQREVADIKSVQLIFDTNEILQGITFKSAKHNFKNFENHVSSKYQLKNRKVPFVGNKFVEYEAPNAIIQLNAPHLSFTMSIVYASQELLNAFSKTSTAEKKAQQKNEASQF